MTAERAADPAADANVSQLLCGMEPRLRAFLGNLARGDVDDLVQETLARAWRSRRSLDPARGSGESWLLRIAFRTYLDHRARRGDVTSTEAAARLAATERDPAHAVAIRDHANALLARLPARERDVLLRFHRDGESIEAIAAALSMPVGTVKSHLHRARNRLAVLDDTRGGER